MSLSGCLFFYPRKIVHNESVSTHNDKACEITHKKLVLDKVTYGKVSDWPQAFHGECHDKECLAWFLLPMIAPVSTFIVSGSIVLTGNVVYWLEAKGKCVQNGEVPIQQRVAAPVSEFNLSSSSP